jgi:hypothetical protein
MANKICVGGNDYVKNELWMETFLDLCYDKVCNSSDIINKTVSFQNNIFKKYYPDLDINDIDEVVKLVEKISGETVYGRVEKKESGTRDEIREYIVFVNKMYNKLLNLAAPPSTSRADDQLPDTDDGGDGGDGNKLVIIPESKKTIIELLNNPEKTILKNYEKNKKLYQSFTITEKTVKQLYNYLSENIEQC